MIDTHCHLTYAGIVERLDEVLAQAAAAGVTGMVSIGTSLDDSAKAVALTARHPQVCATVGIHPHHTPTCTDRPRLHAELTRLAAAPKVVALGEMGLDWHYPDPPRQAQREVLAWQLEWMHTQPNLPGVIHNREATADVLPMLRDSGLAPQRFVFHCFTGSDAELEAILDYGAMVGFTGIVTFKNAATLAAAAARVPLERLLIETDAPYLTPEPYRKIKVNEPRHVATVAQFLAQRRGMSVADFTAATDANARRFYRWPASIQS